MNTFTHLVAAGLLGSGIGTAALGPGHALADPLSTWTPNAHNNFTMTDDPDPNIPPPPPPPTPFCTPRGGLFIVGPICDEIGVGPPERHG